ncbi:MADS-box transcription factor 57-like [Triticum dicoccoides]|uniref:MADS-box transcription factor 57-like n=1 Tax=Triticum dicoccoides TaxID=85692 RepID=UPI000E7AF062|nr:MADS-box transcription factor 57-like [Triticum dicoccoides]
MPRREIRVGVCHIDDDKQRSVTFSKRRAGLFKSASNLSALTGVKVAVVLESESGKMHAFGTPSVEPIIDAFLSRDPLLDPLANKAGKARIASLQSKVARLDMENAMLEKRANLSLKHIKKMQAENPGMAANNIFSREKDICLEDLKRLFNDLLRVNEHIRHRMPPLHHGHAPRTGGPNVQQNQLLPRGPSQDHSKTHRASLQSTSSHHVPPQVLPPVPLPPTLQHTMEPSFHMQVPQILQSPPSPLALQLRSLMKPIPHQVPQMFQPTPPPSTPHLASLLQPDLDQAHGLPPKPQPQLEEYASPYKTTESSQNKTIPNFGGNDIAVRASLGYDNSADAPSDQVHYNEILGMDSYMGYNGSDVGQYNMGRDEWVNAPPESSGGNDGDIDA